MREFPKHSLAIVLVIAGLLATAVGVDIHCRLTQGIASLNPGLT